MLASDFQIPLIDVASNIFVTMDVSTLYYSPSSGSLPAQRRRIYGHAPRWNAPLSGAPVNGAPIFVLSTITNQVTKLIQVPQGQASPAGTAPVFSPDGRLLFVARRSCGTCMIDTATDTVRTTIPLGPTICRAPLPAALGKVSFYIVPGP